MDALQRKCWLLMPVTDILRVRGERKGKRSRGIQIQDLMRVTEPLYSSTVHQPDLTHISQPASRPPRAPRTRFSSCTATALRPASVRRDGWGWGWLWDTIRGRAGIHGV
jgi:hypothetical protein